MFKFKGFSDNISMLDIGQNNTENIKIYFLCFVEYNLGGPTVAEQSPITVQNSPMSVVEDSQNSADK